MPIKEITNRRSCREYKSKPVSDDDLLELVKAAQFAPSAKHNQAAEFIIIKNQKTKEKLAQILGQEFLKQAPVLIVPTTDTTKSILPTQDLSVASENIFLQAAALGLGTVWKNVWEEKKEEIKKLLGLPKNFILINIIPVGYPQEPLPPHAEADFDERKIHWEKW